MKKLEAENACVLVIGSGGREHAIGIELDSNMVETILFLPGNGGTSELGGNIPIPTDNFELIFNVVKNYGVDLIIVGPEEPLANGIVDFFRAKDVPIIGPTKAAAQIESSKIFARNLMAQANIPQPAFIVCPDKDSTERAMASLGWPFVLKVDGLAAGKGAFVCHTIDDVEDAMKAIYEDKKFGDGSILVEECLFGQEMSVFVLCNESSYAILGTAQDYKRLLDDDKGPNTGSMGAIAPSPLVAEYPNLMKEVEEKIIVPALKAMKENNTPFTGFLYCGLMIADGEPFVIEFNCRMGDPETQVVLPLLAESFFELLVKAVNNEDLGNAPRKLAENMAATFVVKVAGGYPNSYRKGDVIEISEDTADNYVIIHAGTKLNDNEELVTNGGRVIGVLGLGENLEEATDDAYAGIDGIHFADEFYRRDIGKF
jgi:phosphoribosylamine--glycine ligase